MSTMQMPLIVETLDEAVQATVMALGGYKRVASELWPELAVDAAGRRLSDCLNPDRREHLSPQQLMLIRRKARQAGVHVLAVFEARDAGYQDPVPMEPEDERARLQRDYIAAVKALGAIASKLDTLQQ